MAFGPPLVVGDEFGRLAGVEQIFIFGSWAARYAGESGVVEAHDAVTVANHCLTSAERLLDVDKLGVF